MTNQRPRKVIALLLAAVLWLGLLIPLFTLEASAASERSSVLEDLTAADNFSIENYPNLTLEYLEQINTDTNPDNDQALLEVIQIAESKADELFVYVYQPTHTELDLTATAVLLSTEFSPDGQNINPDIYYLELVSTDSVFDKYVVKDFSVSDEPYRYYNLVTLYRNFHPDIDEVTPGGVIENFELGIGVGQQWCAYYKNDTLVYEMNTFDTVEIDIGYTGSAEFSSGFQIGNIAGSFEYGDAWFIAFNVEDYIVKKIYNADLTYKIRDKRATGSNAEYGDWSSDIKVTLTSEDTATYKGDGIFAQEYTWNKICSSADFIAQLEAQDARISDEAKTELSKNAWVFAFLQTEKEATVLGTGSVYVKSSQVSAVTVIRLHFMDITGTVYNLGVVSDRVSPDDVPDAFGDGTDSEKLDKMLEILFVVLALVALIAIWPFVKAVFSIIATGVKVISSIIWSVVTLPFKLIRELFLWLWRS